MSGTGRPTYRSRKGTANPGAEYIPTKHVMVRDLPGHKKIKLREKKVIDRDELLKRLEKLDAPKVSFDDAAEFDEDDTDDSESSDITSDTGDEDDEQTSLKNELQRMLKERAEEVNRKVRETQQQIKNQFTANPLLDADYSTKRKWTEEAIFQNQAIQVAPMKKDNHVNDPIRTEYHQKFLQKYLHM